MKTKTNKIQLRVRTYRRFFVLENGDRAFISNPEFAQIFAVSPRTASRWRNKFGIPHFRSKGKVQYYLEDVLNFIYASSPEVNTQVQS